MMTTLPRRMQILQRAVLIAGATLLILTLWVLQSHRLVSHARSQKFASINTLSLAMSYHNPRGEALYYRLLTPTGYGTQSMNQRYPLVITLHGDGCNGTDNLKQLTCIVPSINTEAFRRDYPCFVLSPQCPPATYWVNKRQYAGNSYHQSVQPTSATRLLLELLPSILQQYPIDGKRIYVIGYSSGGVGVWEMITRRPTLFAAAVPISGRGDPRTVSRITHMPIWIFHGAKDHNVGVSCAREMVQAITAHGGTPRYTEYPDAGHEAGFRALADPALFAWLFAQRR